MIVVDVNALCITWVDLEVIDCMFTDLERDLSLFDVRREGKVHVHLSGGDRGLVKRTDREGCVVRKGAKGLCAIVKLWRLRWCVCVCVPRAEQSAYNVSLAKARRVFLPYGSRSPAQLCCPDT